MHEVKSIQDLLNQISRDEILLPEFQRGYVWNRDQVRARRADACRWWLGGFGAGRAFSVQRYGMFRWGDLFTARQKVALVALSRSSGAGTTRSLGLPSTLLVSSCTASANFGDSGFSLMR